MITKIAEFELRYQLRSPVFWVTAAIVFTLTFLSVVIDQVQMAAGGNVLKNSSYATLSKYLVASIFFMLVTTAFVSNVIVRDDDTGYGAILRSTGITKFAYLFGRFIGAYMVAAITLLTVPLALWSGSLMPWVDTDLFGPTRLADHLYGYFILALPNLLTTSAIFFTLAASTRSMMTTYLGLVAFLIMNTLANSLGENRPHLERTFGILEPFGMAAFESATRYWSVADRNVLLPELAGPLLYNRLLWVGISVLFLVIANYVYSFAEKGTSKRQHEKQKAAEKLVETTAGRNADVDRPPQAKLGRWSTHALLLMRVRFETKQVVKSPAFVVLMALGLFNVLTLLTMRQEQFGTPTLPVTQTMIPLLERAFGLIPMIIAIFYAGELVWRERDWKVYEIIDASPIPNWAYLIPKTLAVALVLFSSVLVSILAAVAVQLSQGYTYLELDKYVLFYLLPQTFDVLLLAMLAVFVQAISPSKYAGWGIMVLFVIWRMVSGALGLDHNLYNYAGTPIEPLTDINGSGGFWKGAWVFRLYWAAFATLLLVVAHLLWRRGSETRLKPRLRRALPRLRGRAGMIALAASLTFVGTGAYAYYNTNVLNDYYTRQRSEKLLADYEKKFLKYEALPQPTVAHVKLNVALFPEERKAVTQGKYLLRNLTEKPITDVHVRITALSLELLKAEVSGARLESNDEEFGYRIFRLDKAMLPGEARVFSFETRLWHRGFTNNRPSTNLVHNGTFLNNTEIAPSIGMGSNQLLSDRATRRRHGLPSQLRTAKLEDLSATKKSYLGGGWTTADITISTSADQTPVAPGKRVNDIARDGRRTARFISDGPILNFFSIQSARFAEKHRQRQGVELSVYYHPGHEWNVDRMLNALSASLDYYQANFGPYQFDQARIIEFPGYRNFAQAFANTMPYSEAIGFIADNSDPERIDYVTYITAHEFAHQYWAHQVMGAEMQGATMLTETLAQYSALMVMKKFYGEDKIRRFLKFELDSYLRGRSADGNEELPLGRVENQQYIHYNKGSLAMYLLQERLGEYAVNRALRIVLNQFRFKSAPYPRSLNLIKAFRREARSVDQQALITDLFERITLYDLKVGEPLATRRPDGKWLVMVPVEARKFYASGMGLETEAGLNERIEVGLFTKEPGRGAFDRSNVLVMQRRPIRSGKQVLRLITHKKPSFAGIDPYNFYVDRNSSDNVMPVTID